MDGGANFMAQIAVVIPPDEVDAVATSIQQAGSDVMVVASQGFDAANAIHLWVRLTPAMAAFVSALYSSRRRADKYVSVEYKGREIEGVSETALLKILERG
jgi:hypothetical protein